MGYNYSTAHVHNKMLQEQLETTPCKRFKICTEFTHRCMIGFQGDVLSTLDYKQDSLRIPEGHCSAEGDHFGHSLDSNVFGPITVGCRLSLHPSETQKSQNCLNILEEVQRDAELYSMIRSLPLRPNRPIELIMEV
uniref:Uncharacterized protein n=1 Tax=Glossina austeni TaxID=7395 RepID=A0A1A9VX86_GLOAU